MWHVVLAAALTMSPEATVPLEVRAPKETVVIWGTESMLREKADDELPQATTDANGTATLLVPKDEQLFARLAGPRVASAWTPVRLPRAELRGVAATRPAFRVGDARTQVELRPADSKAPPFRAIGIDRVTLPPIPADMFLRMIAWSDDSAPAVVSCAASAIPAKLELPRGFTVRGIVEDVERNALAGAEITAHFIIPREHMPITKRAVADANGRFVIRGLAEGDVQWTATHEPFATRKDVLRIASDDDLGAITLHRRRTVAIHITDDREEAVANATIIVASGERATTDDRGNATLRDVPADETSAVITAPHHLKREIGIGADEQQLAVQLERGVSIRARVVDRDGSPAGSGDISLELDGGLRRIVELDANGVIELDALPAGRLTMEIRAGGAAPIRLPQRELAPGEVVDLGLIEIGGGSAIVGRAIDADSATPLAGVTVRVLRPSAGPPLYSYVRGDWASAESSADGTFAIRGLSPGTYTLWTEARGHAAFVKSEISVDHDVDLGDVAIPTGRTLSIRCTPARRCGREAAITLANIDWMPVSAPLNDGIATAGPLAPGTAVLRLLEYGGVVHEREIDISANEPITEITLELSAVTVSGNVSRMGKAVGGGSLVFSTVSERSVPWVMLAQSSDGRAFGNETIGALPRQLTASVQADGRFELEDVTPGDYQVAWIGDGARSSSRRVTIPESKRFALRFDIPAGSVDGIVRGESRERVLVICEQGGRASELTTYTGEPFSFAGLEPGKVHVRAKTIGLSTSEAEAIVDVDERVELQLKPKVARELSVHVKSDAGPTSNAFVFVRDQGTIRTAMTDSSGHASIRLPRAGSVDVAVYSPSRGWTFAPSITADETTLNIGEASAGLIVSTTKDIEVWSPTGFPIHHALATLGMRPHRLAGVPAGNYRVVVSGAAQSVDLRRDIRELRF